MSGCHKTRQLLATEMNESNTSAGWLSVPSWSGCKWAELPEADKHRHKIGCPGFRDPGNTHKTPPHQT